MSSSLDALKFYPEEPQSIFDIDTKYLNFTTEEWCRDIDLLIENLNLQTKTIYEKMKEKRDNIIKSGGVATFIGKKNISYQEYCDLDSRHKITCVLSKDVSPIVVDYAIKCGFEDNTKLEKNINNYFSKYISQVIFRHKALRETENKSFIQYFIDSTCKEPLSKRIMKILAKRENVYIDYMNVSGISSTKKMELTNYFPDCNTRALTLKNYDYSLNNLPNCIKYLYVSFSKKYLETNESTEQQNKNIPLETQKNITINKNSIYGTLELPEGIEWLVLANIKYINVSSLPPSLKGLILPTYNYNCPNEYTNFPEGLEYLSITYCKGSTIICPSGLKVLQLQMENYGRKYNPEDTTMIDKPHIIIPDTLERLQIMGHNNDVFDKLPKHLKSLQISIDSINLNKLYEIIPLNLEELIIEKFGIIHKNWNSNYNYQHHMEFNINLLVSIISKLKKLKLLIIEHDITSAYEDFENKLRESIKHVLPEKDSTLNKYFTVFESYNHNSVFNNSMTLIHGYCECYCEERDPCCSKKCECTRYPYSRK
jgi:hypothetical protein